ncbi:MAG: ABC transporter permease subunit [Kiritimatiellia bacterium]
MPIISAIGRRSFKVRMLIAAIYLVLGAGAVTMVYPFLLMVAGSTKSSVDVAELRVIPSFLVDDLALYRKHIEGLFNESLDMMKYTYGVEVPSFERLDPPQTVRTAFVEAWSNFLATVELPFCYQAAGYMAVQTTFGAIPRQLRRFVGELRRQVGGDITELNRKLGTSYPNWNAVFVRPEDYLPRRSKPGSEPLDLAIRKFKASVPPEERYCFSLEGFYKNGFLKPVYGKEITGYNSAHGTNYKSWEEVHLDRSLATAPDRTHRERADWLEFVRHLVNVMWIRLDPGAAPAYREFLRAKYAGDVAALNRRYGTSYGSFEEIPLPEQAPVAALPLCDWEAFLQGWKDPESGKVHMAPDESLELDSVEFRFRDYLQARFASLTAVNVALDTTFLSWSEVLPPQQEFHYLAFLKRKGLLRREFAFRNYRTVVSYVLLQGRALVNTAIYCGLSVLAALIVNPLAAYALSRFRPPSTYKILLFLMLTMAFPPMVTQIPVFLMLRRLGLLNTFWALILPGLANGYSIFLLKGFFDSLPKELYESAALDGAGEMRIFWQITMSLSKPILAVVALNAFTHAYSNFMMALLICQDPRMWTLMPWLYQLQQYSSPGIVFASLIVAALPTFVVFIFCQNVIMRGIVVPVEK